MMKDQPYFIGTCDLQRPIFPSDLSGLSMAGAWFLCLGVAWLVSFVDLPICLQLPIPKPNKLAYLAFAI